MNFIHSFKQRVYRTCNLGFCASLFVLSALSFNTTLNADDNSCNHSNSLELGIALETNYWNLVQEQNVKKFSNKIAHIFQGLNISGIYTRDQQIDGLTGATLRSFCIKNPIAHRFEDVLVFSYDFIARGSDLTSGPTLTVWRKYENSWKIVSHSYVPFQ